jgi:hypothetical protein
LVLDINPALVTAVYPVSYTNIVATVSGLPAGSFTGRLAFRYFVTNGGPAGPNSNAVSIDTLVVNGLFPVELMTFEVD